MGRIREVLDTPVLDEVDVLVCGGGMTGFPAALAAARNGASTILLESEGSLGGTATAGLMSGYAPYFGDGLGSQIVGGIIIEFTERLEGEDALPADAFTSSGGHCKLQFDPDVFKRVAMDMVREAGVEVILNGHARSPLMEDGQVLGVSFQTRMGGFAIRAKTTVDATGDGSIAAWAGAPFEEASDSTATLMYRICNVDLDRTAEAMSSRMPEREAADFLDWYDRHGTLSVVIQSDLPDIYGEAVSSGDFPADPKDEDGFDMQGLHGLAGKGFAYVFGPRVRGSCLDPRQTSRQEMDAYDRIPQQMRLIRRVPGLGRSFVVQVAPSLGVRASRYVTCEYGMTSQDIAEGSRFPDAVGQGCRYLPWLEARQRFKGKVYQIPYRALVPREVKGLLIGGRSVSRGNVRNMVNCAVMGEACGTAAAISAWRNESPEEIPVPLLQRRLTEQGAILGL